MLPDLRCIIFLYLPGQTVTSYHISEQIIIYVSECLIVNIPPVGTLCDVLSCSQAGGNCDSEGNNPLRLHSRAALLTVCPPAGFGHVHCLPPQVVFYMCVGGCEDTGLNFAMPRCQQKVEGRIHEYQSSASRWASLWWSIELSSSDWCSVTLLLHWREKASQCCISLPQNSHKGAREKDIYDVCVFLSL